MASAFWYAAEKRILYLLRYLLVAHGKSVVFLIEAVVYLILCVQVALFFQRSVKFVNSVYMVESRCLVWDSFTLQSAIHVRTW